MTTVLITGANRGLGRALAERFAARGATVIAGLRRADAASNAHPLAATCTLVEMDVTDPTSLERAAHRLAGQAIDILICNAGINGGRGGLDAADNSADLWARMFATNVAGVFFTVRALAPHVTMAKGKIVVLSSRMGSSAAARGSNYAYRASKAAASNIAINLAAELRPAGVAVGSYHPGWVKTDMGGPGGEIDIATSVDGLMTRIDALSLATSGVFENYDGTPIAY